MIYEELADEKISIFGYSEPLVPYEKAMEACRELVKERKKAYYNEHKTRIRTYYKEWYEEQKEAK